MRLKDDLERYEEERERRRPGFKDLVARAYRAIVKKSEAPCRIVVDVDAALAHSLDMDTETLTKVLRRTAEESGLKNLIAASTEVVDEDAVSRAMQNAELGDTVAIRRRK